MVKGRSTQRSLATELQSATCGTGRFSNASEMSNWPIQLCKRLFEGNEGHVRLRNLHRNLRWGLNLYTEYSGEFSLEVALSMLSAVLEIFIAPLPSNWLRFYQACDTNTDSLKIAKGFKSTPKPEHFLGDVSFLLDDNLASKADDPIECVR